MASDICQYDCSKHPNNVPSNPDISGIGVSLGYVITAGIAVLIVIFYYVTVYDPIEDVFHDPDNPSQIRREEHKPNAIDVQILGWIPLRNSVVTHRWFSEQGRIQIGLARALLIMSDLQLFTGIAVILSGFSQLHCGVSKWHWNRLVYIAWFSSITHFACLTSLRGYLHQHRIGRLWRCCTMSILIILIAIALVPTGYNVVEKAGSYYCGQIRPEDGDYMICYFSDALRWRNTYRLDHPIDDEECGNSEVIRNERWGMVASIMLLVVGMLMRLLKLYPRTSKSLTYGRRQLSIRCESLLVKVYLWSNVDTPWSRLRQTLCYRPLLTIFLSLRLLLDFSLSMAFEIYWLLAGFAWGNGKLFFNMDFSNLVEVQKTDARNWSFGQVMPLLLLAAPIVAVLETMDTEPKDQDAGENHNAIPLQSTFTPRITRRSTDYRSAVNTSSIAVPGSYPATFDPRMDFYNQFRFMRIATIFLSLNMLSISIFVILSLWVTGTILPLLITHPGAWAWSPIPFGFSILMYILYGLLFEDLYARIRAKDMKAGLLVLWAVYILLNVAFLVIFAVLPELVFVQGFDALNDVAVPAYTGSVGLYVIIALVDALVQRFKR